MGWLPLAFHPCPVGPGSKRQTQSVTPAEYVWSTGSMGRMEVNHVALGVRGIGHLRYNLFGPDHGPAGAKRWKAQAEWSREENSFLHLSDAVPKNSGPGELKNGHFQKPFWSCYFYSIIRFNNAVPKIVGMGSSKMAIFKNHFCHDIFIQLSLSMYKMTILALLKH